MRLDDDFKNNISKLAQLLNGGQKRQQIRQGSNNFLSLVWNITKLPHRIVLDIPKNRMFFVFRYCYILAGKRRANFGAKKLNSS